MAVSKYYNTYGLLNAWQRENQESIWRFNQAAGTGAPVGECQVYIQDDREQIAIALNEAWMRFTTYLNYFPRPIWTQEDIPLGKGYPYQLQTLRTRYGYIEAFGQRASSLISANAAVVYSDADGDGVNDTATVTVASMVSIDEAQLFFRAADGAPGAADVRYQIEPVTVTASGGNLIFVGHRALFVKPSAIWDVPFDPADPNYRTRNLADTAAAADFVTAVDVYRVYNDTTTTAQLLSDPLLECDCADVSVSNTTAAVVRVVDSRLGIFQARVDCSTCVDGWPEIVRVYYKSGFPLQYNDIEPMLKRGLIRLANANMYRKLCTFCPDTAEIWNQDRLSAGAEEFPVSQRFINNPFGTMKGHVHAWMTVSDRALVKGGRL